MDSDHVNRWLTLGANVGVLIGIVLLIVELDQNRDMMRSEIRNEMAIAVTVLLSDLAYSPEFGSVYFRGISDDELTVEEEFRFSMRTYAVFRYFENVQYQYRQGLYDESEFATQKIAWRNALASERVTRLWCGYRDSISIAAREEIDALLTVGKC